MKTLLTTATAILICAPAAIAQEESSEACWIGGDGSTLTDDCGISKDDLLGSLDLAAPANPLFTLMGATPEKVIKPKPGESFMFSYLPDAVDAFGQENTSIGIEINPGNLMMPEYLSPQALRSDANGESVSRIAPFGNSQQRAAFLSQFTLSAAYIEKNGDTDSSQYGLGLSYVYDGKSAIYNGRDFRDCVKESDPVYVEILDNAVPFGNKVRSILAKTDIPAIAYQEVVQAADNEYIDAQSASRFPDFKTAFEKTQITIPSVGPNGAVQSSQRALTAEEISEILSHLGPIVPAYTKEQLDLINTAMQECGELVTRWNRPVYGGGVSFYHTDIDQPNETMLGTQTDVPEDESGWGIWASASLPSPFGTETKTVVNGYSEEVSNGQFVISARYNDGLIRDRKVGDETITESVDGWSLGGRYVHQLAASQDQKTVNARAFRAFVEAAYSQEEFGDIDDEFYQLGIGAEFQLRKDLFFQFIIGDTFNSDIDRSTYLTGEFKWSFSSLSAQ